MKKIATDKMQSAILRDMIGVESADMYIDINSILDAGTKDERYYLGVLIGLSDIDYENMDKRGLIPAYSLDALVGVLSQEMAEVCFYRAVGSFNHWICRWRKRIGIEVATLHKIGKTKVDAAFEVVVSLCNEGYIKRDHAER